MSGQTEEVVNESTDVQAVEADESVTLEALRADLDKVIGINKELIASRDAAKNKAREAEQKATQAKEQRQGIEGQLDAMEQKFNEKLNGVLVDSALEKELALAGARNVDAAKKLLDRQNITVIGGKADAEAIQHAINGLKETDAYMFADKTQQTTTKPAATKVARAGEAEVEDVVAKEIAAATNIKDLHAVMAKHGLK